MSNAMLQPAAAAANGGKWEIPAQKRLHVQSDRRFQGQIHKGANTAELCAIIVDEAYIFDDHLVHLPVSIRTVRPVIE